MQKNIVCFRGNARDYSLDNIRFFLIFIMVFAHLLEVCTPSNGSWLIYKFIYTFHIPVFLFLFGYNIKYSPKRIVYCWCIPYVLFQTLYLIFAQVILNKNVSFQYTTPYWILWYMLVCIFYQLLLPLYDIKNKRKEIFVVLCVAILSLLIGFEDSIGYYMSLSRFFVFQPWFVLGYYCKKNNILEALSGCNKKRFIAVFISIIVILLSVKLLLSEHIPNALLYGSCSYTKSKADLWMRGAVFLISLSWVIFLFVGLKPYINKKIAYITKTGQNTWPIFLLHGFVVKSIPIYYPELLNYPLKVLLISCVILFLMGNKIVNKAVYYISFSWMEKFSRED